MLIGLLSDSHGRAEVTARAVGLLREHGAEMLIHLGDIETESVIDELAGHNARVVFGNCDWNLKALAHYAGLLGVAVDDPMGQIEVGGKRIAYTHGHQENLVRRAMEERVDYLVHGHTHRVRDARVGPVRVINPGALFRAARYTAALLDPVADKLRVVPVPRSTRS
ncbi:MAG: YfcE family phosphodiesterase [Phycisphaerales bacterium]|nr:MAG: YfcE family phosphodiesterase [Phycisphaerales bacterium]